MANYVAGLAKTATKSRKVQAIEIPPSGLLGPVRLIARQKIQIVLDASSH
jgi:hypothetical protein